MSRAREDRFDELFPGSTFSREECQFLRAIDRYKSEAGRQFLSWHEVLRLVKQLGYRKTFPELRASPAPKVRKRLRRTTRS
jgi:hypothetical protein